MSPCTKTISKYFILFVLGNLLLEVEETDQKVIVIEGESELYSVVSDGGW